MNSATLNLDDPTRFNEIEQSILKKKILKLWYEQIYSSAKLELLETKGNGLVLELGSGASFIKKFIPDIITSDVIQYDRIDKVVDATQMPFQDKSIKFIFLMNVLHHIPNPELFFKEANRCLIKGGKIYIVDQYPGIFSYFIYKYLHHEPFRPNSVEWSFPSNGPLSGANGALAKIIFFRDINKFNQLFPSLNIKKIILHSPFTYWLSGGLKKWCLIPNFLSTLTLTFDKILSKYLPKLSSFVNIVIEKN